MLFVLTTTLTAGWLNITDNFLPLTANPKMAIQGYVNCVLTAVMMVCAVLILIEALKRWYSVLVKGKYSVSGQVVYTTDADFSPPEYGCC